MKFMAVIAVLCSQIGCAMIGGFWSHPTVGPEEFHSDKIACGLKGDERAPTPEQKHCMEARGYMWLYGPETSRPAPH